MPLSSIPAMCMGNVTAVTAALFITWPFWNLLRMPGAEHFIPEPHAEELGFPRNFEKSLFYWSLPKISYGFTAFDACVLDA